MATVTKFTPTPVPPPSTYKLELNQEEAEFLYAVLECVGSPDRLIAGHIHNVLECAGGLKKTFEPQTKGFVLHMVRR